MNQLDLKGEWKLSLAAGSCPVSLPDSVPVEVPGDNITALLRSGLIPNPAFSRNELDLQWIGRCDWRMSRTFTLEAANTESAVHYFTADSLDTIATVTINGVEIASSDNMFQRVRTQLPSDLLKDGENTIEVVFHSPENAAVQRAAELPYPVPYSTYDVQSPHRNLVRKVQCHSGWDWGPSLMVSGVPGDICIETARDGMVEYLPADLSRDGDDWTVTVEPVLRVTSAATAGAHEVSARVLDETGNVVASGKTSVLVPASSEREAADFIVKAQPATISVADPELWWPAGEGRQVLYTLEVSALGDTRRTSLGFRTLELRRDPDEFGSSFEFVVNGRPVFAKGANWIPQSALPGLATDDELKDLLQSAVDANMNMLRIWGGGTYESDRFYELCDELGIMVWQDFMFSCSLYPATPEFLESVRTEVRHQVLRLKNHACIALWCGNNENVGALTWYDEAKKDRDRYLVDYDRLNEGVVGSTVRALDPGRTFWPSSPVGGPGDYSDNWIKDRSGDMHYWSVWHSGEPFASYRSVIPRFCSEFGFQSFPARTVVETFTTPDQFNVTAPDMEHHQRSPGGNTRIVHTMTQYYRFPTSFDQHLYLSQVQQASAIQTAVEYWRSQRPRCMGTLFWQLNDTWPTASWSSIDYGGQWKLLHYAARRFYNPVLITAVPVDESGAALASEEAPAAAWHVYVVNDTSSPVSGTASLQMRRMNGETVSEVTADVTAAPGTSERCMVLRAVDVGMPASEGFGFLSFDGETAHRQSGILFLTQPKRCNLPQPTISVSVAEKATAEGPGSARTVEIVLGTDQPAFHVALSLRGESARFSDNMVSLMPDRTTTVTIQTELTGDELKNRLQIMDLAQIGGQQ